MSKNTKKKKKIYLIKIFIKLYFFFLLSNRGVGLYKSSLECEISLAFGSGFLIEKVKLFLSYLDFEILWVKGC